MKIIGGFLILFLAAVVTVILLASFNSAIDATCEKQKLDTISQYCYERIIKTN